MTEIAYCAIHPSIGIAGVGNSPTEYFIGPELPGAPPRPEGGFKDGGDINRGVAPRIKRQAARFRVYAYAADGTPIGELTSDEADIEWTVHLANRKAEWDQFDGPAGEDLPLGSRRSGLFWRNRDMRGGNDAATADIRKALIIDPGPRTIGATNGQQEFLGGVFMGIDVPLGEIRTDDVGRLLVLGGFGKSGTSEPGRRIAHYANNDRWYDDVSDGPVTAKVVLRRSRTVETEVSPSLRPP